MKFFFGTLIMILGMAFLSPFAYLSAQEGEGDAESAEESTEDAEQSSQEVLQELEEERIAELKEQLGLEIPDEIDDPNYTLTFTEPTEEGVEIRVDDGEFSKKKSPYSLPSLSIGKHTLDFRFQDNDEITQNLSMTIIVIPRPPVFNDSQTAEFGKDEEVKFEGTALPNSKLVCLIDTSEVTSIVDVDEEGNWLLAPESALEKGNHGIVCFIRKDGYASNLSDPFEFSLTESQSSSVSVSGNGDSGFDDWQEYIDELMLEENRPYFYAGVGLSAVLILLVFLAIFRKLRGFLKKRKSRKDNGEKLLKSKIGSKDSSGMSLRDKFASVGIVIDDKSKKDKKEDEKKDKKDDEKKMKIISPDEDKDAAEDDSDKDSKKKPEKNDKKKDKKEKDEKEGDDKDKDSQKDKKSDDKKKKIQKDEKEKGDKNQKKKPEKKEMKKEIEPKPDDSKSKDGKKPKVGKVYSKDEFLKEFEDEADDEGEDDSNKIKIDLTSK